MTGAMDCDYILVTRSGGPSAGSLHLFREGAEASLCGIPYLRLTGEGVFDEFVCRDCTEWLPKRLDFSYRHPNVELA